MSNKKYNYIPPEVYKNINNQGKICRCNNGKRWLLCPHCGKIATSSEFVIYGGKGVLCNRGICYDCNSKGLRGYAL